MRLTRVVACTSAAALLALATAGPATAATSKDKLLYSTSTSTGVVSLVLRLPSAVPALPGIPNPVELTLLGTAARGFHGPAGSQGDIASAQSFLAGGSLVTGSVASPVLAPLNRIVSANLLNPGTHSADLLSVPPNALGLALDVADQSASAVTKTLATGATGSVTSAELGSLRALGVGALLDPALAQLRAALDAVVDQATPLTDALSLIPTLPTIQVPNPLQPVVGGPEVITTPALSGSTLSDTVNELPARIEALTDQLLDGALLELGGVQTSQSIVPTATSVLSKGAAGLTSVKLFGGLVTVSATKASASALAGLTKSAAKSDASATLLEVTVSDAFGTLLQAIASDKGLTAGLLDGSLGETLDSTVQPVVEAVDAALGTVLSELTGLLTSLNSGAALIQQGTVTKKVSADGRSVEAHAVPAQVTLGLPIAPNLISLAIGSVDSVSSLSVAAPTIVTPPSETPVNELPHTGGAETGALLALLLVGLPAAVALRRRTHSSAL